MATLGHPFVATISICRFIWPENIKIIVFCTRKSGHFIQMATVNVATIFRVHCSMNIPTQRRQFQGHNTPLVYCTDQGPVWRGQYNGQGLYCGLSYAYVVFFIFTTKLYQFLVCFFYSHHLVMSLKYSFLNTTKKQNSMLLTSGGK